MRRQEAIVFPVTIPIEDEDALIQQMAAMRAWLDHRKFQPSVFRYALGGPARDFVLYVDFASSAEAVEFAGTFGGQLTAADLLPKNLDFIRKPGGR